MENHTDNSIDSTESDLQGEKGIRAPRAKYFFCAANQGKKIIHEAIEAKNEEEAREIFESNKGMPALICDGGQEKASVGGGSGYYLAKGTAMSDAQRISVTISADQMRFTSKHVKAQFRGWVIYGNGLRGCSSGKENFSDNELVSISGFDSLVDPNNKVSKPKLKKTEVVRYSDLHILHEAD
jgi:hypothetical protein